MSTTLKYPIGIQSFPKIIEGGYIYVDKTQYIKMLTDAGNYCFLSRPRRFGKSLFLSTLEAYFEGRQDLFKGLAIYDDVSDRMPCPVFMFSFNTLDAKSEDSLDEFLDVALSRYERKYGKDADVYALPQRFENLIVNAYEKSGQKVVVLVDEYDAPLLNTLGHPELNDRYRQTLKAVFSVLKSYDRYIEFAFVTGVSRFGHTSLFSGANNFSDNFRFFQLHCSYLYSVPFIFLPFPRLKFSTVKAQRELEGIMGTELITATQLNKAESAELFLPSGAAFSYGAPGKGGLRACALPGSHPATAIFLPATPYC